MKIELARHSGFCMGVRHAVLKTVQQINSSDSTLNVYGPLIHNPQTLEILGKRGLKTIDSLDDIDGEEVAIRTHGIPVEENREIKKRSSKLINLTCSRVARVQALIKKHSANGYFILITGDRDHAEVTGLQSYATCGVFVISDLSVIPDIPDAEKYVLVSQTTFDRQLFEEIKTRLVSIYDEILVIDTICDSTRLRQQDVINAIKNGIDTLVVVGGMNSANTRRLAQIGKDNNIRTFHVETEEELSDDYFIDSEYILVTAGASTPGWIINNVLESLISIKFRKSNIFSKFIKMIVEFMVRSNLLSSITAFFLSLVFLKFAGIKPDPVMALISSLFLFAMYSVNNYFDRDFVKIGNPYKFKIYNKYSLPLLFFSNLGMIFSLVLSTQYSHLTVILLALSYIFGYIYSTGNIKKIIKSLNLKFLRQLYNTKIVTGFGWLLILVVVPLMNKDIPVLTALFFSVYLFVFIVFRQLLVDLIAFQSDLILGRETLPILFGQEMTNRITVISVVIAIASLLAGYYITVDCFLIFCCLSILYFLMLMTFINNKDSLNSLKYEVLVDLNFIPVIFYFAATQF